MWFVLRAEGFAHVQPRGSTSLVHKRRLTSEIRGWKRPHTDWIIFTDFNCRLYTLCVEKRFRSKLPTGLNDYCESQIKMVVRDRNDRNVWVVIHMLVCLSLSVAEWAFVGSVVVGSVLLLVVLGVCWCQCCPHSCCCYVRCCCCPDTCCCPKHCEYPAQTPAPPRPKHTHTPIHIYHVVLLALLWF